MKLYEELTLFGKKVPVKHYLCTDDPNRVLPKSLKLNLYIKINDACNGLCAFCSNRGHEDGGKLDLAKLKEVLLYLKERNLLNRVSVTGGEPLLNMELLNDVLNLIFEVGKDLKVTFNTNGFRIKEIIGLDSIHQIEGIHISRHHYLDDVNNCIFGTEAASSSDILDTMNSLDNKHLLRLNCLLMKDYIDSPLEVQKYLESAARLNIFRVGFVSLMKVNPYCEAHFVDFNTIFEKMHLNNLNTAHAYDQHLCECLNGVYVSEQGKFIEYYARMTKNAPCNYARQFVYTSDNKLLAGFGQESII